MELKLGVILTYFVHGLNYPNQKKNIILVLCVIVKKEKKL